MGNLISAREELRLAVQLDPTHQFAQQTLDKVEADLEVLSRPDGQHQLEELKKAAREAKVKPPVLDPTSKEPITLVFPQPKPVKEIYQAMAKAYGFNVLFDPKLKDDRIPIELNDVTAERALEIVMQAAGQFYKVLDAHSIIIADDTPQNRREYEDLVIKTFFLSNADVKDVDKLLRSLIEARRLSTNEQLNAITLRDTADKVAIAEKLISTNDKAKAEVLVDVELLEVNRGKLQDLGTQLSASSYNIGIDLDRVNEDRPDGGLYLEDLDKIGNSSLFINVPSLLINLAKSSNEATALAQPKMRITEGEKGSLVIGDRIPIPVTSFNSANNVGSGIVPVTSFQYQDVGIKIDVEPRVHHNREITLKVTVEVSQVSGNVVQNNQSQPIIGTRTINTVIRLQDGETNMLVGLYKEDNKVDRTDIPGLGSIPLVGRLFRNEKEDHKTTDLVLTLTPHILRFPDITEEDLAPMWVGTESNISYFGAASPRVASGRADQGPFDRPEDVERPVPPGDEDSSAKESPFHVRRSPARPSRTAPSPGDSQTGGVDLVPGGGLKSLFPPDEAGDGATEDGGDELMPFDPNAQPIRLNLEPSVVSLHPDQGTYVSLVTRGGSGAYRLPFGLSFDPTRLEITSLELAPGVTALDERLDPEKGFLWLDLQVAEGQATSQSLGSIGITALNAGSAPLVFTCDGAVTGDGFRIPVAAGNGAVFVSIPQGIGGK
jgi:general secretion pathway protein D